MKNKIIRILVQIVPIILMVALIPLIKNDFYLSGVFVLIIGISLVIYHEKNDLLVLVFGLFMMTISEYFFLMTGVETFNRTTLFGIMPVWLPILWAYGFVAIKRSIEILDDGRRHR